MCKDKHNLLNNITKCLNISFEKIICHHLFWNFFDRLLLFFPIQVKSDFSTNLVEFLYAKFCTKLEYECSVPFFRFLKQHAIRTKLVSGQKRKKKHHLELWQETKTNPRLRPNDLSAWYDARRPPCSSHGGRLGNHRYDLLFIQFAIY